MERVYGYTRVSTDDQAETGLGLAAQLAALEAESTRRGWDHVGIVSEVGSGGSMAGRPLLRELLDRLDRGEADALIVSRLDRLARSVGDFSRMLDRAERHGWSVIVLDCQVDTSTPAGRMVATILASTAEYERSLIRTRTREALTAKKAAGHRLGRPSKIDRRVLEVIVSMRDEGNTLRQIADALEAAGHVTATGCTRWHANTIRQALRTAELDREAVAAA